LDCVDLLIIFEDDTPVKLIECLEPDVMVKGSNYWMESVVGREILASYGGKIHIIPLLEGYSTTRLTEKMSQVVNPRDRM
jgi:D-beta-D-heptose 7-phosphate kinase / D-beta-D-heptose 1-phosphate adenosyltransferase